MFKHTRNRSLVTILLSLVLVNLALLVLGQYAPIEAGPSETGTESEANKASMVQVSATSVHTWTHNTRVDWRAGMSSWLDSVAISGSLQLAQRLFGESTTITPREDLGAGQTDAAVAMDAAGSVYAVWRDGRNGNGDIYFAYRTASGTTWSASARVNDDIGIAEQSYPAIAVDPDGNAYAVWIDDRSGKQDIYFAYRPVGGTWGANTRINDGVGTTDNVIYNVYEPAIAVDATGSAYVVWVDSRNGHGDIYFAHQPSGGAWGSNERVNDDVGTAYQGGPDIALDANGTATVVWVDMRNGSGNEIFAACRPAGGQWSSNVRVSDDPDPVTKGQPAIAVDAAGNAYAAWYDFRNNIGDIYFSYRPAGGQWSANTPLDSDFYPFQGSPDIAVDAAGNAYVIWQQRENGEDIFFAYRAVISTTWSTGIRVNDDLGTAYQYLPAIALSANGDAYAVWGDQRDSNPGIYGAKRTSGGEWSANEQVDDDIAGGASQDWPSIAADASGNTYAVWRDLRNGNADLYFAYRPAGEDWGTNVRINDDTGTAHQWTSHHAVAVDATGNAHAIWMDQRNGDWDIYAAYRPMGGAWGTNVRINDDGGTASQGGAAVAVDVDGNAYAIWGDARDGEWGIYFAYRPVGGSWGSNVKVSANPAIQQDSPDLAVDADGNVYAVWQYDINGVADIYSAYRAAGSAIWSIPTKINDDAGDGRQSVPSLAVGVGGHACAAWENIPDWATVAGRSIDFACRQAGGDWGASVRISNWEGNLAAPALAIDASDNAYALWTDWRNLNPDIYFAYRPAGGEWGNNVRINDDPGTARQAVPAIAVHNSGTIDVLWVDESYATGHIRSARSISTPEYVTAGTYASLELDAGVLAAEWGSLTWQGEVPVGTSLTFETRSRSASGVWSPWESTSGVITSPPRQYLQYRAAFSSVLTSATPRLDQVQIIYNAVETPSAPIFITPCGVTNQTVPVLKGSATAGITVHLHIDGSETAAVLVGTDGSFAFAPALSEGMHTLSATAEGPNGVGPASSSLNLLVNAALSYDPIRVRAGQWSQDGWLMSVPRDEYGCADPDHAWRIWPREDQALRVEVPVSYTASATVTVTVGTASITLIEENTGSFTGVFEPPIENGDFVIEVTADGETTTITGGPVLIDPDGYVYEAGGTMSDTIPGVQVHCDYWDAHSGHWLMWDAWVYDQINPQTTLDDGYYSFYTPPGTYRVVATKDGYTTYASPDLVVVSIPVRHNIPLEKPGACPAPLAGVGIIGPLGVTSTLYINTLYTFEAVITPTDVTLPITYTWVPVPTTGQETDSVVYLWGKPNTYTVTLTAENCGGPITATRTLVIQGGDEAFIYLPLVLRNY